MEDDFVSKLRIFSTLKAYFHCEREKEHFFVPFIYLFALKIEASAKQSKKINKTNKE